MKKLANIAAASALSLMATTPAFAAEVDSDTQGQMGVTSGQATTPQERANPVRASKIVGANVVSRNGDRLGEIKDIVISSDGRISYVGVSAAILGVGDDIHPVPWQALRWSEQKGNFVLNLDKEIFKQAPGFNWNNWPIEPGSRWADFYKQYGISEEFSSTEG